MSLLKRLQKKPPHHRRRIAFVGAFTISLFIFSMWVVSFPSRYGNTPDSEPASNVASPFSVFRENFGGVFGGLKDNVVSSFNRLNVNDGVEGETEGNIYGQ